MIHMRMAFCISQVIQVSSNVGASKIALSLDNLYLWNTFNQIGFGAKTGIHFPGEAAGKVRDYEKMATNRKGNHAIVTASCDFVAVGEIFTQLANEGELKPVSLIKLQDYSSWNASVQP